MSENSLTILRGTLDIMILKTLSTRAMHGYELNCSLSKQSCSAFQVNEGVLYPALRRMENKGWLKADWGMTETGREARIYQITEEGRAHLAAQLKMWDRYVEAMALVLSGSEAAS